MTTRNGESRGRPSRPPGPLGPAGFALLKASLRREPAIEPLIEAVPSMLAEAQRRRRAAAAPAARVGMAARFWLPRLAAVTALLVLTALLWPRGASLRTPAGSGDSVVAESASLESWLVTGRTPSSLSDPVLDALVR